MSQTSENSTASPDVDNGQEERKIMVSVIMITYNQEDTIDEAIRGVLSQKTDFDYELIIANDASTDSTGERVTKWAEMYPQRIVAVNRTENLGLQRNFLDAFKRVRGKYIAICEGDDWWCSSQKLASQVAVMEREPIYSICFHRVVNYYEDDGTMSLSNGRLPMIMSAIDLAKANMITNLSVMYRTEVFKGLNLESIISDLRLFDYALHILASIGGGIYYINKPMAVYRQRKQGIWSGGGRDTQLRMAMATRLRMIQYLTEMLQDNTKVAAATKNVDLTYIGYLKGIIGNLTAAMNQIALSLLIEYEAHGIGDDEPPVDFVKNLIYRYSPDWDEDRILEEKEKRRCIERRMQRKGLSYLLTLMRQFISRFLPLPRIRDGVAVPK